MKKKQLAIIAVLITLVLGGGYCMTKWIEHQNSPYNVSDVLDDKGVKLYKRGFRLLEEQLATYIKEHYSGVSKIEFSPIFVQGGDGQYMFHANVVPVIYDTHGNKVYLGRTVQNFGYASYGDYGDVRLDFNGFDEEIIELRVGDDFIDIAGNKMDENIEALVKDGQLKDVVKSEEGSPSAEVIYNTEIKKGYHWEWH